MRFGGARGGIVDQGIFWVQDVYHGIGGKIGLSIERNDFHSEYYECRFNVC
jgi:hypothetical protein